MENYICPYCKQRIEFEEGKCKVCTIKNHLWNCEKHRQLNRAKEKLFHNITNDIDEKTMQRDPEKGSEIL